MTSKEAEDGAAKMVLIMLAIGIGLLVWGLVTGYWAPIVVGLFMLIPLLIAFAKF